MVGAGDPRPPFPLTPVAAKIAVPTGVALLGHSIVLGASGPTDVRDTTLPGHVTLFDALNGSTIASRATWPSAGDGTYERGIMHDIADVWTDPLTIVRYATSGATVGGVLNTQFPALQTYYALNALAKPDAVYIGIGENDAQNSTESDLFLVQLPILLERIHAWAPNARVFVQESVLESDASYSEIATIRAHQATAVAAVNTAAGVAFATLVPRTGITTTSSSNPHWTIAGQTVAAGTLTGVSYPASD